MKVSIKKTEDGELYIEIPEEYQKDLQWEEGDLIEWIDNQDGSWTAKRLNPLQQLKEKAFENQEVKLEYERISNAIKRLTESGFEEEQAVAIAFVFEDMKEAFEGKKGEK